MAEEITLEKSNIKDLQFGFELLGDYARFMLVALPPQESARIGEARKYIALFDGMLAESREPVTGGQLAELNIRAFREVQDIRKYMLLLLKLQITKNIIINLNPQTINMMVNTTELLLEGLNAYMLGQFPDTSRLTSTWLQNMYITTKTIEDLLGLLYFEERNKAHDFANTISNLYTKSLLLDGMRRTGLTHFPALEQFHKEIHANMQNYATFLVDLINLISKKEYTGLLSLLNVDSIYRRVCFFMTHLSRISGIPAPVCDPSSPRLQAL